VSRDALRRTLANVAAVAWKEATIMRHDRAFLAMVSAQPVVMLLLFGFAIRMEPANVPWAVLDRDGTALSRRFVEDVTATGYFRAPEAVRSYAEGRARLARGQAVAFVVIPAEFRRELELGRPEVQVLLDGTDPISAARVGAFVAQVGARLEAGALPGRRAAAGLELRQRFRFNPTLSDRRFYLAALAGMLLTNFCLSVTAAGLVGEREAGTWEQMLSTPTSPLELVLGKLVPYAAMSYVLLGIATLGSGILFDVWPAGGPWSWLALGVVTLPFVGVSLAMGVFVSTLARTSAQAVFITVFFILPSMVLSGVMLPYQLMPDGVRQVGALLPLRWYQIALRRITLRGAGLDEVVIPLLALSLGFLVVLLAIRWRLKPRLA
jgi:ABC-2 type transport system permease protein